MASNRTTNWQGVFLGLSLSYFAAYQLFKIPPVLPVLLQDFGYDRTLAGGFMSVYAVSGLLLSLPLSHAAERWGFLLTTLAALALTIIGSLLCLIQPDVGIVFLASRAIEGIGYTILAVIGPTLVNVSASPRTLPLLAGLMATWIPFGQMSAVVFAWLATADLGWQALWTIGIFVALVLAFWTVAAGRQKTPGSRATGRRRKVDGCQKSRRPRAISLVLAALIFLFWAAQYFAYMTWLPQFLVEQHHMSLAFSWLAYILPVAVLIVFNLIAGTALRGGLSVGTLLCLGLAAQATVWWTIPAVNGLAGGIISLIGYGAAAGLTATALFATPSAIIDPGQSPTAAFGTLMTGRNMGVLIGPILVAEIFKAFQSWDLASSVFASLTTAGFALAVLLRSRLAP